MLTNFTMWLWFSTYKHEEFFVLDAFLALKFSIIFGFTDRQFLELCVTVSD